MFRCYSYTFIMEHINLCLLKLQLLQQSVSPLPNSATYRHQYGPNICSHITTVLTAHRCILVDCCNSCNFSEHKLMRSLMKV